MINFIRGNLLLLFVAVICFYFGYVAGNYKSQQQITKMIQSQNDLRAENNRSLISALNKQQQLQKINNQLTESLHQRTIELEKVRQLNESKINEAVTQDNSFNGLGAFSLQLYRTALGYVTDYSPLYINPSQPNTNTPNASTSRGGNTHSNTPPCYSLRALGSKNGGSIEGNKKVAGNTGDNR